MSDIRPERTEYVVRPVGVVTSGMKDGHFDPEHQEDPEIRKAVTRERHRQVRESVATVTVFPEYAELLEGIEAFSHILVVFWPHGLSEERRTMKQVHPMGRKDLPIQGIFATRSPARPNPVLISQVRLLERDGRVLRVKGLDALDRSPVIDLKPVLSLQDQDGELVVPEWIKTIRKDLSGDS